LVVWQFHNTYFVLTFSSDGNQRVQAFASFGVNSSDTSHSDAALRHGYGNLGIMARQITGHRLNGESPSLGQSADYLWYGELLLKNSFREQSAFKKTSRQDAP
jgi:hypothetical protein